MGSGKELIALALFVSLLTQATFAKDVWETEEGDAKLVGSPIKDSWKKGEFTELKDGTKIRNSEPDVDTDGDFKHSEELREKMIKSNTHKMIPVPDLYPSPPATKTSPTQHPWSRARPINPHNYQKPRSEGRKVKSIDINGNDVKFNPAEKNSEDNAHSRKKRNVNGAGLADDFEFTLEALAPFNTDPATFKIGSVIPYKLIIHTNHIATDVKVEIFSELAGGAHFMVSNVRLGTVGINFPNYNESNIDIRYYAKFNDGRWDYATVDMGSILNDVGDSVNEIASKIELLFEMQALVHEGRTVGNTYRVSVGAMYQSESYITVAQDDLTYADFTPQSSPTEATFSIEGPDTLDLGVTGVWKIEAVVYDLYSDITVDVLAPLHATNVMSIDSISVLSVGANYRYSAVDFDDGGNFTRTTYENYGNYGRLNLGTIINSAYHDTPDLDPAKNTITFEVALTMLEHDYNETDSYIVGFTVWKKDQTSIEIMWSAQQGVLAENKTLAELVSSPTFTWGPSAATVEKEGRFAVVMNMSVPSQSSARYRLEASVPVNDSKAMMEIERVRISRIGHNIPHVDVWVLEADNYTMEKTDTISTDFISWDLGIITNTGQRSGKDDHIIQFEITIKVLSDAETHYGDGDDMFISLGMKHADDYYWVGRTSVKYSSTPVAYNGEQIPEFSFVNVMGSDSLIYKDSAAVYDLDMIIPPGVDYANFMMEISTTNFSTDSSVKLRIVSMELVHIGKAIYIDNKSPANLTYQVLEEDEAGRPIYTAGLLAISRVTSLRDEDFDPYSFADSTLRVRTKVVARSASDAALIDSTVYWTEATVSFADSYIYAVRAGIQYNDSILNPYGVDASGETPHWQPLTLFELKEGSSKIVYPGTPVVYNVTVGIPYRTVSDIMVEIKEADGVDAVQICRVKYLNSGSAIVDYNSPLFEGDVVNSSTADSKVTDMASHYKYMVSSFDYGYYVGDVRDSYVTYEVVVMLTEAAVELSNYTFFGQIALNHHGIVHTPTLGIAAVSKENSQSNLPNTLPEIEMGRVSNGMTKINLGGSELYYVDIFVTPGTHHSYVANVFAPWNSTFYGDYELLEAYVVSAGENLACYDNTRTSINVTYSSDNASGKKNLAIVTLGSVPSLGEVGSDVKIEANRLRIVAHVAITPDSKLAVGDMIPIAATVDISGEHLWVGYVENEVVQMVDTENENAMAGVELIIKAVSDNVYHVGETQQYTGRLILPAGSAYTDLHINIASQEDDSESRIKVFDLHYMTSGINMLELATNFEVTPTENNYGVEHIQDVDLKFARNSDISNISSFIDAKLNYTAAVGPEELLDDHLMFNFSIQLLDTVALVEAFVFPIDAKVVSGSTELAAASGDTNITVTALDTDDAAFEWNANILEKPDTVYQDSQISFYLDVIITDAARRFPSDVQMHIRVPHFSELGDIYNQSVLVDQYTDPTSVESTGLVFKWTKIRWENFNYMKFNITVDPQSVLEPGLGTRVISIPVDISYSLENKATPGTFTGRFTEMRVLTFAMEIPENMATLGMGDDTIKDCQITASSDDGTNVAVNARPTSDGWSTAEDRGSPVFGSEYIQVDLSGNTKITGVTIYAFKDVAFSRIDTFKIQYSRRGIRWDYALDNAKEIKTFTVSWPDPVDGNTAVVIPLELSSFVAQHIRILPQSNNGGGYTSKLRFELHGYGYPMGTTLPSYTCPGSGPSLKAYEERQILAVPSTQELYACTINKAGELPYCSGTDDFGVTWFAMDDNLLNVYGYDSENVALYGLARNRDACLRSKDFGVSWKAIDCAVYNSAKAKGASVFIESKEIPFPLVGATSADLVATYGTELDTGDKTWSVSNKGLHAYTANTAGVASKTDSEEIVAYWGNKQW